MRINLKKKHEVNIIQTHTSVKLKIGGMSCVHCQTKIENALNNTDGILKADVSYGTGTADIIYDEELISLNDIENIVESLDYSVIKEKSVSKFALFYPIIIVAVIIILYSILQYFGVLNYLAPSSLADSSMSYGMLFIIGLITSVHCIAMCGGINLSQCIPKSKDQVQKGIKTFFPALFYNLGRVISYTLIGFILGLIGWLIGGGSSLGISLWIQAVLKIIAGILMIIMGVNMLGIIPWLRRLNPTLPKFISKRIGKSKSSVRSPFIVGILNGIMPCGPLQSMWLVALATGNPFSGALSMFLFSLGTVPLMLGLGSIVAKLGQKFTKAVMTVGSVLVVVLGLAMLSQGGSLTGVVSTQLLSVIVLVLICIGVIFSIPIIKVPLKVATRCTASLLVLVIGVTAIYMDSRSSLASGYDVSVVEDGVQTVNSVLETGSYPNISVKKDIPVVWIITAEEGTINGCNYKLNIQEYDIEYVFKTGENIIEFTPTETGNFSYCCWMGMIYGTISVT